jgi:hypothetical protein
VIGGPVTGSGPTQYPCMCSCGQQTLSRGAQLRNRTSTSCGCARKETLRRLKTTHGKSKTPLHVLWCGMKARCSNPRHIGYCYYGAKGIRVSKSFSRFEDFERWAISAGYAPGLTLERRDGRKGYSPRNCVWANRTVQNRNSSHIHLISFRGRSLCLSEWAEVTGIPAARIRRRLKEKWPVWMALTKGKNECYQRDRKI